MAVRGTRVKGQLPVTGGVREGVSLVLDDDLTLLVGKGDEQQVRLDPQLPEALPAPVEAGQPVGSVTVSLDGREVARIPVVAAEAVEAKGLGWRRVLEHWVGLF